jgi:hypothetical protein
MGQPRLGIALEKELRLTGVPQVLLDSEGAHYVLLRLQLTGNPDSSFRAYIDDFIPIYGEGATEDEAILSFQELLKTVLQMH